MKTDIQIQQDVINQIKWDPFLKASELGVSSMNGIVTLSGHVDSYLKKVEAEKSAKKVLGVRAIVMDIKVGISPSNQRTDLEIADAVLESFRWHTSIPEKNISLRVENGIVTLKGEVEWNYQRNAAKDIVSNLAGVINVINLITVKAGAIAEDIRKNISHAFERLATIDANKIAVEVIGDKVVLHGMVSSYTEKQDAESAAWSAPGITLVESFLQVAQEVDYSLH